MEGAYERQLDHDKRKLTEALREAENELAVWRQRGRREERLLTAWKSARRRAADLRIAEDHIARGNEETNKAYAKLRTAEARLTAVRDALMNQSSLVSLDKSIMTALNGDPK